MTITTRLTAPVNRDSAVRLTSRQLSNYASLISEVATDCDVSPEIVVQEMTDIGRLLAHGRTVITIPPETPVEL